jgi:hypothetical protein
VHRLAELEAAVAAVLVESIGHHKAADASWRVGAEPVEDLAEVVVYQPRSRPPEVQLWIHDQDDPASVAMTPEQALEMAARLIRATDLAREVAGA